MKAYLTKQKRYERKQRKDIKDDITNDISNHTVIIDNKHYAAVGNGASPY